MFEIYKDKTVLITGHTGFKGAWMTEWLMMIGAKVVGYSLEPPNNPSLYDQLDLINRIHADYRNDIRDRDTFDDVVKKHQPDFVFHLAAQTLVGEGYKDPIYNYETNIMGTINILETLRKADRDCICIAVTTDKVYENEEWLYSYRENDSVGGYDPYSASKGCCEIVISSYARSYFNDQLARDGSGVALASVRAGNVVAGGDWAVDRIVPDCIRSLVEEISIPVRNKVQTRPWQHVLEPLAGYLKLAEKISLSRQSENKNELSMLCSAFNFGPNISSNKTVENLVEEIIKYWPGSWVDASDPSAVHEAGKLNLSSDKAYHVLDWRPRWSFEDPIKQTVEWSKRCHELGSVGEIGKKAVIEITRSQIKMYESAPPLP